MEDKKQDLNSLQELVKEANAYSGWLANLEDELSKVLADIQTSKKEEDTWEMKYPYKNKDVYWFIHNNVVEWEYWEDTKLDKERFEAGNTFSTEKAALLEAKRRNLLTRFKAFRDECNDGWEPNWTDDGEPYFYIFYDYDNKKMKTFADCNTERNFHTFGYFKYDSDCRRAIDLFGDEIKELFVDCEG